MCYMRTPKEFTDNLKAKIITTDMLNECLYSVNKRAKNYRNAKRECWGKYRDLTEQKEQKFYQKKERLLSILSPICIHKSNIGGERIRVYNYEQRFDKEYLKRLLLNQVVHTNSYLDYETGTEVFFFDYCDPSNSKYLYFLFYELGTKSYHTPIKNPKKYDLPVKEIGKLETDGDDYRDLISVPFVDKVIALIESGDYTYKKTEPTISQKYDNELVENNDAQSLGYFERSEIRNILKDYIISSLKTQSLELYKNEFYKFSLEDFSVRQKYKKKRYQVPRVRQNHPSKGICYELDDETISILRTIAKQKDFTIKDLVTVILKNIDSETYKNYYLNQCKDKIAKKLERVAIEENKRNNQIELSLEELAKKCDLLPGKEVSYADCL